MANGIPQPPHPPSAAVSITQRIANDLGQWQPRLGLAWSPDSKTVLRLSSGLYAAPTPGTFFHRAFTDSGAQTVTVDSYFDPQLLALTSRQHHRTPRARRSAFRPHATSTPSSSASPRHFRNPTSAPGRRQRHAPTLAQARAHPRLRAQQHLAARTPAGRQPRPTRHQRRRHTALHRARALTRASAACCSSNPPRTPATTAARSPSTRRSRAAPSFSSTTRWPAPATMTRPPAPTAPPPPSTRSFCAAERGYSNLDVRHSLNVNAIFNLPAGFKLNPLAADALRPAVYARRRFRSARATPTTSTIAPSSTAYRLRATACASLSSPTLTCASSRTSPSKVKATTLISSWTSSTSPAHGNRRFGPERSRPLRRPIHTRSSPPASRSSLPASARFGGPRTIQFTARLVGF